MKLLLFTGDHYRHFYFADKISELGLDVSWIIQKREAINPIIKNTNKNLSKLLKLHFNKREEAELNFFKKNAGEKAKKNINNIIYIKENDIQNSHLFSILKKNFKSEILLSYGPSKIIPEKILNLFKLYKWNVHGGLSPWYRGTATLFWPTYLLEPEYTGITLHEMSNYPDAGNIIHQTNLKIKANDGIHDNACRAVKEFSDIVGPLVVSNLNQKKKLKGIPQNEFGRNWTSKMWNPFTLEVIYDFYGDRVNKYCLENKNIIYPKLKSILI